MPESVEERVDEILDENPDMDESEAYAIAYDQEEDASKRAAIAKSAPNASTHSVEFEAKLSDGPLRAIWKADDGDCVIWGPASVEVVDKENDRIKAEALEEALPQLLKRSRLSYEHSDQIVGDILDKFETEEPRTVEINGHTFERSEFPTDVLKLDGMEPALYVAGNIYNDTQKAREVREKVEEGKIDSYSISGEAVTTEMAVKDGQTFTDIVKIDLSAVTLCEEGMNQKAKFGVVSKATVSPDRVADIVDDQLQQKMSDDTDEGTVEKIEQALNDTLDERLPDGDLATKEDVEETVEEKLEEKAQEGSPTEGTPERPSGNDESPTEQDEEYEGDNPDNTTTDSDKVEEKGGYSREELKAMLPDDQFKAIEPLLDEKADDMVDEYDEDMDNDPAGDEEEEATPDVETVPGADEAMNGPAGEDGEDVLDGEEDDEGDLARAVKALDFEKMPDGAEARLIESLAKSGGDTQKASGPGGVPASETEEVPAHQRDSIGQAGEDALAKADNEDVVRDPAMRDIYAEDGTPQI